MTGDGWHRYDATLDVESWSETIDELTDGPPESRKIVEHEGMFPIAQRYIDGLATLHLHLRIRSSGPDEHTHELCAVVKGGAGAVSDPQNLTYVAGGDGPPGEVIRRAIFGDHHPPTVHFDPRRQLRGIGDRQGAADMENAMLVHVVEPRDGGERVRIRRLGSKVIGLGCLDQCPIIRAYSAKHPTAAQIPLPAFVDGKLRAPTGAAAPKEHELPKEIVERGPQVVAELPDDQPEPGVGRVAINPEDIFAGIALEVTDDSAIFLRKEGLPFSVERGQVLVRAFESPVDRL
jgi:hypothetical protein